jgi:predicted transcriptional regulator
MSEIESQDVITYKQQPVKFIRDKPTLEIFKKEHYKYVLKFLQKGPMTITDLMQSFEKLGEDFEKSDKSIYRYLKDLIKAKLVAKAGKRIIQNSSSEITTETIFIRTAIAFITVTPIDDRECKGDEICPVWESTRIILEEHFNKKADPKKFADYLNKIDLIMDDLVINIFENANEENLEKIAKLDYMGVSFVLRFVGWLAFINQENIAEKLNELFK